MGGSLRKVIGRRRMGGVWRIEKRIEWRRGDGGS